MLELTTEGGGSHLGERHPLISDPEPYDDDDAVLSPNLDDIERFNVEKSLLKKLDLRMSVLILIYILNYIDRNNAAAARLRGFEEDLGLSDRQFATVLSILYVGYLVMQIPSNMLLNSMNRPSLYLPSCMIVWGALSVFTGFASGYLDVLLIRFCLGFVEAAFFPGALFLLSKWYKRDELGRRTALLQCGNLLSNAFGTLIASGILNTADGVFGYAAWRWLFFTEGFLTVAVACGAVLILPDFPSTPSKWLNPAERSLALKRMIEDAGEDDDHESAMSSAKGELDGLKLAVTDWKVWWFSLSQAFLVFSLSFSTYFPTITATLGYNTYQTLLLCSPPWIFASFAAYYTARLSDRTTDRFRFIAISLAIAILGFLISISTMNGLARYASMFLMAQAYSAFIITMAWVSNSIARPPGKRAVAIALINMVGNLGNVFGSYIWPRQWGPSYAHSYSICIVASGISIAMCYILKARFRLLNEKMEKEERERGQRRAGFRFFL